MTHSTDESGELCLRGPSGGKGSPYYKNRFWETRGGTLRPMTVLTKQERIATLARNNPVRGLTTLNHYIDEAWLYRAFELTRKDGAAGVDGQTGKEYAVQLKGNLQSLLSRLKSGRYQAPPTRRAYIPKSDGTLRPLGVASFEDKVAQRAIVMLLEPIYEQLFMDCSFGFRPRKSAHQALNYLRNRIMNDGGRWIIDIDIRRYFDSINKTQLRKFLDQKVKDGVVRRLIDKWLKAGVFEEGRIHTPEFGTGQGSVISPLLANIYLHYVLDEWFAESVVPKMKGRCSKTRYADDLVMVFERYDDCKRVFSVLDKRLNKFGLSLHPDKTRIVDFRPRQPDHSKMHRDNCTFNFLGFTHLWVKSRNNKFVVRQRTAKDRLSRTLVSINDYCKVNRHKPIADQHSKLTLKLRGHYSYFGITGNDKSLRNLAHQTERIWHKWLSRRSRKSYIPWLRFKEGVLRRFILPKPRIYHQYCAGRERIL